jgi:hypothetical protein
MSMVHSFNIEHAAAYGIPEAIFINYFQFWLVKNRANGTHFHDGRTWTYNSVKAFGIQFPYLTGDQIRRALDSLEKKHGVLVTGFHHKEKGKRDKWYAFADEAIFLPDLTHLGKKPNAGKKEGDDHLGKIPSGLGNNPKPFGENPKSSNETVNNTVSTSDKPSVALTSDELFELAWAAYPKRPGASKSDSLKQWNARLNAGADPLAIIEGVKAYAAFVVADGTLPKFIKQPVTFFGPGNHYDADWSVAQEAAPPAAAARPVRFDPNAFVNSGAAYANPAAAPARPGADPYTIDAQFVERPA